MKRKIYFPWNLLPFEYPGDIGEDQARLKPELKHRNYPVAYYNERKAPEPVTKACLKILSAFNSKSSSSNKLDPLWMLFICDDRSMIDTLSNLLPMVFSYSTLSLPLTITTTKLYHAFKEPMYIKESSLDGGVPFLQEAKRVSFLFWNQFLEVPQPVFGKDDGRFVDFLGSRVRPNIRTLMAVYCPYPNMTTIDEEEIVKDIFKKIDAAYGSGIESMISSYAFFFSLHVTDSSKNQISLVSEQV